MLPHPLTNFEIQKYYENEPRFIEVFSRDSLTKKKIKDGAYVINFDEYALYTLDCFILFKKMKLFILIALEFNIFLKKLKNLLEIKI